MVPEQIQINPPVNLSTVPVRQIKLTMPESMFVLLKKEQDKYLYKNIQEIILEAIRDKYIRKITPKFKSKKRNLRKIKPERILLRKKIFSKTGKAIRI